MIKRYAGIFDMGLISEILECLNLQIETIFNLHFLNPVNKLTRVIYTPCQQRKQTDHIQLVHMTS